MSLAHHLETKTHLAYDNMKKLLQTNGSFQVPLFVLISVYLTHKYIIYESSCNYCYLGVQCERKYT